MTSLIVIKLLSIICIEFIRMIIGMKNKSKKTILAIMTIIIILIEINYKEIIMVLHYKQKLFEYVCSTIIPIIAFNILYTYLVTKGLYKMVFIIRIVEKLVFLIYPDILNLDWFMEGSLKIILCVVIYFIIKYRFSNERIDLRKKRHIFFERILYFITIVFSIVLVCFMLGTFKYQPISIMSNSMFPLYKRGDVIIFKKVKDLNKIPEGTILIYSMGKKNIAHRIVDIVKIKGETAYKTKGDNNKEADTDLVKPEQILGIYTFHIKYIGFPSIWLYEYFNSK